MGFVDNHVHIPVQKHRHVPVVQKIQKPVEVTVIETVEKIVDVPVVKQVEVPQVQTIEKIVEIPYVQTVEKIVEVSVVGDTIAGVQKAFTMNLPPQRQEMEPEVVQEFIQGPPLPAEQGQATMVGQALQPQPQQAGVMMEPMAMPPGASV